MTENKNELIKEEEINGDGFGDEFMYIVPPQHIKVVTVKVRKGQEVKILVE